MLVHITCSREGIKNEEYVVTKNKRYTNFTNMFERNGDRLIINNFAVQNFMTIVKEHFVVSRSMCFLMSGCVRFFPKVFFENKSCVFILGICASSRVR